MAAQLAKLSSDDAAVAAETKMDGQRLDRLALRADPAAPMLEPGLADFAVPLEMPNNFVLCLLAPYCLCE